MSEEKSFIVALKVFVNDIVLAFSHLFRVLPFGSRRKQLDKVRSQLNRLEEALERIEEKLDKIKQPALTPEKPKSAFDLSGFKFSDSGLSEDPTKERRLFTEGLTESSLHQDEADMDKQSFKPIQQKSIIFHIIKQKIDTINASYPQWITELCALINSDQLSEQQRTNLENAIKSIILLRTDVKVQISEAWLVMMIHQKYAHQLHEYDPQKNLLRAFHEDLIQRMGADYPLVLRKMP